MTAALRFALTLACATVVAACGGRVHEDGGQPGSETTNTDTSIDTTDVATMVDNGVADAGLDTAADVDVAPPADAPIGCSFVDGTEMCGGAGKRCGDCAGSDLCVSFAGTDGTSTAADFGVCWPRYAAKTVLPAAHPCGACPATDLLCASVTSYPNLFCATRAACETLDARGHANSCWFADTTPWRSDAVIPPVACPPVVGLCGPSCGPCSAGEVCIGRSPRHPLGVCARPTRSGTADVANRCRREAPACPSGEACLIFSVSPEGDQKLADAYGICLTTKICSSGAASLPGGASCIDAKGASL